MPRTPDIVGRKTFSLLGGGGRFGSEAAAMVVEDQGMGR
jgi:hypothetical protein